MSASRESIGRNLESDPMLLQSLLSVSDLLVVVLDGDDIILLFNRASEKLSGYSAEEMIGRNVVEALVPEDERPGVHQATTRLSRGDIEIPHTNHWVTRDGEMRLIEWNNTVLYDEQGGVRHVVGTGVDITEQVRAREINERHKKQLLRLLDAFPALVAHIGRDFRVRFANHAYRTWFDLEPEEQVGRHVADVMGEEAFEILKPYIEKALEGTKAIYHGELPYIRCGTRFIHGTYVPSFDDKGEIDGYYSLAVDLTEAEHLKNQLADQLKRSQTIVDNAMDAIITIDRHGKINSFNPAAQRIFGYSPDEVIGRNVTMLMPQDVARNHDHYLWTCREDQPRSVSSSGTEVSGQHKDGSLIDLELSVSAFTEGDRYFVGFAQDISQRKQAEREAREHFSELARVTRLSALGEVTSGLAHEISQPLTAISAMAEASLMMLDKPRRSEHSLRQAIEQISRQGRRAREIIEQLRAFLRKDRLEHLENYEPDRLISNVLTLLTHEIELAEISTKIDLPEEMCQLKINRVQIEQVLFNLIKNAVDAMQQVDGPRLLTIGCRPDADGESCEFYVMDTGPGIAEQYVEDMFHPFFTTKTEGLGQGLSICRSIVEKHGGVISGQNAPDGGALFRFTIPSSLAK